MNKNELKDKLRYLVTEYIEDEEHILEIIKYVDNSKAKYVLGEIDRHKTREYSRDDKETIKDIYFYYC